MSGAEEKVKSDEPGAGDAAGFIRMRVQGQDGQEVHFRVKLATNMGKLMKSYSDRVVRLASARGHEWSRTCDSV